MFHRLLPVGHLHCNCSILADETSREAIIVDPGAEIDDLLQIIAKERLNVVAIVITHGHIDHVGGAMKLKSATAAPIRMNIGDEMQLRILDLQAAWVGMERPGK